MRKEDLNRDTNEIYQIAKNTQFFQDLIGIHIPLYHCVSQLQQSLPTSLGSNPVYYFPTPPIPLGVLTTSQNYDFYIPHWLQEEKM